MRLRSVVEWLHMRSRRTKRAMLLSADVVGLMAIIWLAFCFRFNQFFIPNLEQTLLILAAPVIAIPIFIRMGLYRAVLRYLQEQAIWTMIRAVTFSSLAWVGLAFITLSYGADGVPRTIAVLYWAGSLVSVVGSRLGIKWLLNGRISHAAHKKRVLVYGAGDAAMQLAEALSASGDRQVVGIVSDDSGLHGMEIVGIRVYPAEQLEDLVLDTEAQEVIIAASSSSTRRRRELVTRLGRFPVKIRVLPSIADVAAGKYLVSYVRDIDIDDLLGRSPVPADPELMRSSIDERIIMVTGAAGSIGSEVCRTIARGKPTKLVLFEMNEPGLYQIERELRRYGAFPIVPVLGSVCDAHLVRQTLAEHGVQTVYHCAAYKHVPLVECNPLEGVRNNVFGTLTLVEEACAADVRNFILISSDKAVRPTSVMGATKRWAELIVRYVGEEACKKEKNRVFSSVRFGNVIGSSGSVVPLFKEQIAAGGPVTLTHDDMTRYFMSVREAAGLIVQAGALSRSGDILLLDMGEPIRIRQLAEDMIMLAGFTVRNEDNPDGDIEIVTIGMRDGEKLYEELFYDPAGVTTTRHPKILRAGQLGTTEQIPAMIAQLKLAVEHGDVTAVRQVLFGLIGENGRLAPVPKLPPVPTDENLRRRA
ncbi:MULTISPECIES: polysaccharide biosynthesis protein [Chelativorans]|uniref:polysaccharide biosynthesis protein n=1 Tax=Chelativorans TaxID=449972 RepID=UPI00140ABECB|nr:MULTISPECIES: nucleoside-diphosphate sugar epimerase/dehydratase [Chelativorans]